MKTAGWWMSLVTLPVVIDSPGDYVTRCGELVLIDLVSTKHNFGCVGIYASGQTDRWHKSGRLYFDVLSDNDIVSKLP